jgi:hypothetical protein
MARICARCRQPLDRDAREHDCPDEAPAEPDDGSGEYGPQSELTLLVRDGKPA